MEKIYNAIALNKLLTKEELNNLGFDDEKIVYLIESNRLYQKEDGTYFLSNLNEMIDYAKKLYKEKKYNRSDVFFQKCFELEPQNINFWHELFLKKIRSCEYDDAFQLCDILFEYEDPICKSNANYYLFLLSNITKAPHKYIDALKQMNYSDIKIDLESSLYYDLRLQNTIRKHSLYRNFAHALKLCNDYNARKKTLNPCDFVMKSLLQMAIKKDRKEISILINMAEKKEYEKIMARINENKTKFSLKIVEEYSYKLCSMITRIKLTHITPPTIINNPKDLIEAIDGNNFEAIKHFLEDRTEGNTLLSILSNDLCNEVDKIKNSSLKMNDDINSLYETIKYYLLQNDLQNAFTIIKEHLKTIGKSEYEFLVFDMIKISSIENTIELLDINNLFNNLSMDIIFYEECYYASIKEDKLKQAKVYLDIIDNLCRLNNINIDIKKMYEPLYKKLYEDEFDEVDEQIIELIDEKNQILIKEKGIILLKPVNEELIKKFLKVLKLYPNINFYIVNDDNNKRIVLKYKPIENKWMDLEKEIRKAKEAYKQDDLKGYIDIRLNILSNYIKKDYRNYSTIALAYLKMHNYSKALDYFIVANHFAKLENRDNYDEYISKLKNNETFDEEIISKENDNNSRFYDLPEEMRAFNEAYKQINKQNRIIILNPMSKQQIEKVLKNSRGYSNLNCFVIEFERKQRVVIEYINTVYEHVDIKKSLEISKYYYENGEYEKTIEINLKVIENLAERSSIFYGNIGICYLKLKEYDKALDYLMIANFLAKKAGKKITYDETIRKIKEGFYTKEAFEDLKKQYVITLPEN